MDIWNIPCFIRQCICSGYVMLFLRWTQCPTLQVDLDGEHSSCCVQTVAPSRRRWPMEGSVVAEVQWWTISLFQRFREPMRFKRWIRLPMMLSRWVIVRQGKMSSNDLEPMGSKCGRGNETPKRVPCSQKKQEVYRWLLTARQMARRKQSETSDRIWTHEKSTQQARLASKVRHKRTNRWHRHHSHQHPPWWPRSHGSDTAARIYLGNTPSTPASVADSGSASAAEDKQGPGGGDEIAERPQFWECEGVAAANRRCATSPYSLRVDWGRCLVCAAGPPVCRGRGASPCLAVGVGRRVTAKSGSVLSNAWAAGLARTTGVRRRRRMASVPFELRSTNPNGSREPSRVAQVRASLEQRLEDRISRIEPIWDQQRHRGGRGVPQWARYCGPSLCLWKRRLFHRFVEDGSSICDRSLFSRPACANASLGREDGAVDWHSQRRGWLAGGSMGATRQKWPLEVREEENPRLQAHRGRRQAQQAPDAFRTRRTCSWEGLDHWGFGLQSIHKL